MHSPTLHIAVVEDGAEDFDLLQYAFDACGVANPLVQYAQANLALELFANRDTIPAQLPCLILLDLNLPDIDGRDALLKFRSTEAARSIPIIIFSTSNNPQDVKLCYARGANGYVVKPVGVVDLKKMAHSFKAFWLETAVLPK